MFNPRTPVSANMGHPSKEKGLAFAAERVGETRVRGAESCSHPVQSHDKVREDDWFNSYFIIAFSLIAATAMIVLIAWELQQANKNERPILDLRLFSNRTFAISFIMMTLGTALYGTTVLIRSFCKP